MDLFPEIFGGDAGLQAYNVACATADQTPANNSVVELFNPAVGGSGIAQINQKILTLCGIVVWGAQAAAVNLSIWNTTNNAIVAGAPTLPAAWLDHRRALGLNMPSDTPVGVVTIGNLNPLTPANSTEVFRTVLTGTATIPQPVPFKLPWNEDIPAGSGVLITVSGGARTVIAPIWIERLSSS